MFKWAAELVVTTKLAVTAKLAVTVDSFDTGHILLVQSFPPILQFQLQHTINGVTFLFDL